MKKGKLQINYQLCSFPFEDFLASAGRVAVTEGGDLGGLGVIPQQAFWPDCSGAWGLSLNKHFGRIAPAKIAKHVYVCIACRYVKELIVNYF